MRRNTFHPLAMLSMWLCCCAAAAHADVELERKAVTLAVGEAVGLCPPACARVELATEVAKPAVSARNRR
jgi:hypothetical protein